MVRLLKLYSIPEQFRPVNFQPGLNIILGEKSQVGNGNRKMNGVGKTLSVEFINFCLLKKFRDSRVSYIPENVLENDTLICLNFIVNGKTYSIHRSFQDPDTNISVFKDGIQIIFQGELDDVSKYFQDIIMSSYSPMEVWPSFRSLINPIIRDERCEFKDIASSFDTSKRIPQDYSPHLFFLGFGWRLYMEIRSTIKELENKRKYFSEVNKKIRADYAKISGARAKLNSLNSDVNDINNSLAQLKTTKSFEVIKQELDSLQNELTELHTKQDAIRYRLFQMKSLPEPEIVSEKELGALFNQFKQGLGDIVEKSIIEVREFKDRIDTFRNSILNRKIISLEEELKVITQRIICLDDEYSSKLNLIDNKGVLKDLKSAIKISQSKTDEYNKLKSITQEYDSSKHNKEVLQQSKDSKIQELSKEIIDNKRNIELFENEILDIHNSIMGNKRASFSLETTTKKNTKQFLKFNFKIDDGGSWSTNRMSVFIYDLALLLSEITKNRHLGFLIHDNLFNVDNISLEKSLNFLNGKSKIRKEEFQYVLTLNHDMVEILEVNEKLDFNVDKYTVAEYTKDNRFLRVKYDERDTPRRLS